MMTIDTIVPKVTLQACIVMQVNASLKKNACPITRNCAIIMIIPTIANNFTNFMKVLNQMAPIVTILTMVPIVTTRITRTC